MKPLAWMGATSAIAWLGITAASGAAAHPEALFGMLGPLVSAAATWVAVVRTHAAAPGQLLRVLVKGLVAKAVFFGVYVVVMLRALELRPVPFVLSFTGFFIALYAMEAHFLQRLLTGAPAAPGPTHAPGGVQ